jgi:hypothetical protein
MDGSDLPNFSLLGGYNTGGGGGFASANFEDAEDTRPAGAYMETLGGNTDAIQGIVSQSIQRHISEAIPPSMSPLLTSTGNWRKRLREMMLKQNETLLNFLYKPTSEHPTISVVEKALQRYAIRHDIDTHAIKTLKQLLHDVSGNSMSSIQDEINTRVGGRGPSTISQMKSQVTALLDLYKETGEKLLDAEAQLKLSLDKMDKIQKRVGVVMELQSNDAMPDLIKSLEKYLSSAFTNLSIEPQYMNLLFLYQKHIALREAIHFFKTGSNSTEPLCPICLHDCVSMAIVPCGHTFCSTCAKRQTTECCVCRGRIRDRMKLYFS